MYASEVKKSKFLVNLDRFSKFLKYFKYFEKWSKLTKNSDFFARGECTTLSYQFEQRQNTLIVIFLVNILQFLKDEVITIQFRIRLSVSISSLMASIVCKNCFSFQVEIKKKKTY